MDYILTYHSHRKVFSLEKHVSVIVVTYQQGLRLKMFMWVDKEKRKEDSYWFTYK